MKLTETTNDKMAAMKVTAPHEPLRTGEPFLFNMSGTMPGTVIPPQPQPAAAPAPKKIALVGTAPSSRALAPYNDTSWQIWGCSAGNMNQLPRVDLWFEIHTNLLWPEHEHFGRPYIEWLNQQTFPVYMQDNTLVPRAMPLPRRELFEEFGPYFWTSSFAWMLGMAIREQANEIALFGIDMASRDEYILQRPGAYFFFWEAKRRGIKVSAPHESDIMQPPGLYGFSDGTPFGRKLATRERELRDRVAGMRQERDRLSNSIVYLEGAIEDVDYMRNIWAGLDRANF